MKTRIGAIAATLGLAGIVCIALGSSEDYRPFKYLEGRMDDVCDADDDKAALLEFFKLIHEFGVRMAIVHGDRIVVGHSCHVILKPTKNNEITMKGIIRKPQNDDDPEGSIEFQANELLNELDELRDPKDEKEFSRKAKKLQDLLHQPEYIHKIPGESFIRFVTEKGIFENVESEALPESVVIIRNGKSLMIVNVAEKVFTSVGLR